MQFTVPKEIINDYHVIERLQTTSQTRRLICVLRRYKNWGYIFRLLR